MEQDPFYLLVQEGDAIHRLPVGVGQAEITKVVVHEEEYLLAVTGEFVKEDVYKRQALAWQALQSITRLPTGCWLSSLWR